MARLPIAADTSGTVALIVAAIALIATVAGATVTVLGAQRERETRFQAERRELYAHLLRALTMGQVLPPPAGPPDYKLLVEQVRQVSPDIDAYIDEIAPICLSSPVSQANVDRLRKAMAYQQRPWVLRKAYLPPMPPP
jgi:hypothetical protein